MPPDEEIAVQWPSYEGIDELEVVHERLGPDEYIFFLEKNKGSLRLANLNKQLCLGAALTDLKNKKTYLKTIRINQVRALGTSTDRSLKLRDLILPLEKEAEERRNLGMKEFLEFTKLVS